MPVRERRPRNRVVPDTADPLDKVLAPRARSALVAGPAREDRDTARQCPQKIAPTSTNAPPSHATAIWWYLASSSAAPSKPRYKSRTSGSMTALTRLGATRTTPSPSCLNTSQTRRSSASSPRPTGSRSPSHSSASRSSRHRAVRSPSDSQWHVANRPTLSAHTSTASPHHSTACQPTARSTTSQFSPASFFPTVLPATTATSPCGQAHTSRPRAGYALTAPRPRSRCVLRRDPETRPRDLTADATGGSRRRPPARALSAPAQLWATPRTQHSLRRVLPTSDPASR